MLAIQLSHQFFKRAHAICEGINNQRVGLPVRAYHHIPRLTQFRHWSTPTVQRNRLLGEHLVEGPSQFLGLGGLQGEDSNDTAFPIGTTERIQFVNQSLDFGLTIVRSRDDENICTFSDVNFNRIGTPLVCSSSIETATKKVCHRGRIGIPHPKQTQRRQRSIAKTIDLRKKADASLYPLFWSNQHQLVGDRQHRNIHRIHRLPRLFGVLVECRAQSFGHLFGVSPLHRDHPSNIRCGQSRTRLIHGLFHALHRRRRS